METNHHGFIDPKAHVHETTPVWHFARVLAWARIGKDSSVGGGSEIGRGSTVGERTRISAMVFLPSHSTIGDDVFIGPGAIFTDDRYPKTLAPGEHYKAEPPTVENGASIGAGAVILPGVKIGAGARIAAGAIVTRDVLPGTMVRGEPSRVKERTAQPPLPA